MLFWIVAGVVGLGLYFLSQNKTEKKDRTTITHKSVIQTPDGEVHIQRTQTMDSVRTSYTKKDTENNMIKTINSASTDSLAKPQPVQQTLSLDLVKDQQTSFVFNEKSANEKNCPNCNEMLPFTSFRASSKHEDGLTKWCTDCLSAPRDPVHSNKKKCPSCKKTRLKTSFYKNSKQPDGLTKWCKTCMDKSRK